MSAKCSKCDNEATFDVPEWLCDYHWADWFSYGDETNREEIIRNINVKIGEDEEGWYVEFFCGVQWNRLHLQSQESVEAVARALRRFKHGKRKREIDAQQALTKA